MTAVLTPNDSSIDIANVQHSLDSCFELPQLGASSRGGQCRLTLRKRPATKTPDKVNLSSYNSAFLTGLFADVAKANDNITEENNVAEDEADLRLCHSISLKRVRVSMTKSVSRYGRSCKNLMDLIDNESLAKPSKPAKCSVERLDSLHYQLNELDGAVTSPTSVMSVMDIGKKAFPNMPTAVSESSCHQDLTQKDDKAMSTSETSPKESYGWFVEMDDDEKYHDEIDPYTNASADLAFQAPTAPKRNHLEEELEWAKAADTVDDVLGDFF